MRVWSIAVVWLLASSLAWFGLLGAEVWHDRDGLPGPRVTSAYLMQLCMLFSAVASVPLAVVHAVRSGLLRRGHAGGWATLLVVALASVPAHDQAAFLTTGDGIATSALYLPTRIGLFVALVLAFLLLWWWHLRGLTQPSVGRLLSRLPRWSRYWVWVLAGVTAVAVIGNAVQFHLSAYDHLARMLAWPMWLLLATLAHRMLSDLRMPGWLAALLLLAAAGHVTQASLGSSAAMGRARHEVLRRGKTAGRADLLVSLPTDTAATLDVSHPERFDCDRPQAPPSNLPVPTPEGKRRNVILISIDALRADAVDWKYKGRPLMPKLQRFARQSVRYERAVTPYPATLMALGAAVTGQGPSDVLFAPRPADNIFQRTEDRFDKSFIVLPTSPWFRLPVVDQLLVQTAASTRRRGAQSQTSAFISKLRRAKKKKQSVLAWVHYFEPHSPYTPHKGHERGRSTRGRYRSELSYLDHQLGRLFTFLKTQRFYDDSLVLLFSDHGEALGEQQYTGHHVYLNRWIADVPLMMRAPGVEPRVSRETADLTDIAPTVLDFAGVPHQQGAMVGLSLFAPAAQRRERLSFAEAFPIRGRDLFAEARREIDDLQTLTERVDRVQRTGRNYLPKVSVVSPTHRLIVNRVTGVEELYDRRRDTRERRNLAHRELPVQKRLRAALQRWADAQSERIYCAVARPQPTPDDEEVPDAGTLAPPPTQRMLRPAKGASP